MVSGERNDARYIEVHGKSNSWELVIITLRRSHAPVVPVPCESSLGFDSSVWRTEDCHVTYSSRRSSTESPGEWWLAAVAPRSLDSALLARSGESRALILGFLSSSRDGLCLRWTSWAVSEGARSESCHWDRLGYSGILWVRSETLHGHSSALFWKKGPGLGICWLTAQCFGNIYTGVHKPLFTVVLIRSLCRKAVPAEPVPLLTYRHCTMHTLPHIPQPLHAKWAAKQTQI